MFLVPNFKHLPLTKTEVQQIKTPTELCPQNTAKRTAKEQQHGRQQHEKLWIKETRNRKNIKGKT